MTRRSTASTAMLRVLADSQKADGGFRSQGGDELAKKIGDGYDLGTITGCARNIRDKIATALKTLNVHCDDNDVLYRDESGYCLRNVTVEIEDDSSKIDDVPRNCIASRTREDVECDKILNILRRDGQATAPKLAGQLGCSVQNIYRRLRALEEKVEHIGLGPTSYYRLRPETG